MFAGIIVYIAAIGGTAAQQREFLFLVPKLQVWLHALPIPMDRLGYVVAVGRSPVSPVCPTGRTGGHHDPASGAG